MLVRSLVQVVENPILAAADQVAARRNKDDTGRTEVGVTGIFGILRKLLLADEVAERAPEVGDRERRFAAADTGNASRISELDEAFGKIVGYGARIHPVARGEVDVVAVDGRP